MILDGRFFSDITYSYDKQVLVILNKMGQKRKRDSFFDVAQKKLPF